MEPQLSWYLALSAVLFTIGAGLFTSYLLPFEITSILLLMAIVGAMSLARRGGLLPAGAGDRGAEESK